MRLVASQLSSLPWTSVSSHAWNRFSSSVSKLWKLGLLRHHGAWISERHSGCERSTRGATSHTTFRFFLQRHDAVRNRPNHPSPNPGLVPLSRHVISASAARFPPGAAVTARIEAVSQDQGASPPVPTHARVAMTTSRPGSRRKREPTEDVSSLV